MNALVAFLALSVARSAKGNRIEAVPVKDERDDNRMENYVEHQSPVYENGATSKEPVDRRIATVEFESDGIALIKNGEPDMTCPAGYEPLADVVECQKAAARFAVAHDVVVLDWFSDEVGLKSKAAKVVSFKEHPERWGDPEKVTVPIAYVAKLPPGCIVRDSLQCPVKEKNSSIGMQGPCYEVIAFNANPHGIALKGAVDKLFCKSAPTKSKMTIDLSKRSTAARERVASALVGLAFLTTFRP